MGQSRRDEAEVGIEMCRNCGATYRVTIGRRPAARHDWYNCAVCGRLLREWESSEFPRYTLLGGGPGFPPRKPR